jgi:type III secretion system FlhB-like substrate exporter
VAQCAPRDIVSSIAKRSNVPIQERTGETDRRYANACMNTYVDLPHYVAEGRLEQAKRVITSELGRFNRDRRLPTGEMLHDPAACEDERLLAIYAAVAVRYPPGQIDAPRVHAAWTGYQRWFTKRDLSSMVPYHQLADEVKLWYEPFVAALRAASKAVH